MWRWSKLARESHAEYFGYVCRHIKYLSRNERRIELPKISRTPRLSCVCEICTALGEAYSSLSDILNVSKIISCNLYVNEGNFVIPSEAALFCIQSAVAAVSKWSWTLIVRGV